MHDGSMRRGRGRPSLSVGASSGARLRRELAARGRGRTRSLKDGRSALVRRRHRRGFSRRTSRATTAGALLDLTLRSLTMFDDFVARATEGSAIDVEYRRCGSLEIAADEATADTFRRAADAASAEQQWLTASETRRLEPALPDSIHGAILIPSHGYVAVSSLTEALVWAALRHGAELETGRHVQRIRHQPNALEVTADDGATWTARHVVIASGSWSGQLEPLDPAAAIGATGPRSTAATGVEGPATLARDLGQGLLRRAVARRHGARRRDGRRGGIRRTHDRGGCPRSARRGVRAAARSLGRDIPRGARGTSSGDARRAADHRPVVDVSTAWSTRPATFATACCWRR